MVITTVIAISAVLLYAAAVIILTAWIISEIVKKLVPYLKEVHREISVVWKGRMMDELIQNAADQDVKEELSRIRDNHGGILIPVTEDDEWDIENMQKIKSASGLSDMRSDRILVADDCTYADY